MAPTAGFEPEPPLDAPLTALARFRPLDQAARRDVHRGAAMPADLVDAWRTLLDAIDAGLDGCDAEAVSRLRLAMQTDFQSDAAWFGDVPFGLAARITGTLRRSSERLAELQATAVTLEARALRWPVVPMAVTSAWGERLHPIDGEPRFHAGVDLEAAFRAPVRAAADGVVVFADWNGGHGRQIELSHDARWTTRYSHLAQWLVHPGQRVKQGDLIGLAGDSGLATGPHLHFEVLRDGEALDPQALIPASSLLTRGP